MNDLDLGSNAAKTLRLIRQRKPMIHNLTNYVVMNFTANVLLAMGASPVMAHAAEEVEEMASFAGAVVLNIGTLTPNWIASMILAGRAANKKNTPVILDPVGSGATRLRTESATRLLDEVAITVVRGNASEILSLARAGSRTKGVDSIHGVDDAAEASVQLAKNFNTTVAVTGAVDLVTDGRRLVRVANGHEFLGLVTGTGCAATAVVGAFLAAEPDPLLAAAGGLAFLGLAGETAAATAQAPGSFQVALLDALYSTTVEELAAKARISRA